MPPSPSPLKWAAEPSDVCGTEDRLLKYRSEPDVGRATDCGGDGKGPAGAALGNLSESDAVIELLA